jgi:hypothetical protein
LRKSATRLAQRLEQVSVPDLTVSYEKATVDWIPPQVFLDTLTWQVIKYLTRCGVPQPVAVVRQAVGDLLLRGGVFRLCEVERPGDGSRSGRPGDRHDQYAQVVRRDACHEFSTDQPRKSQRDAGGDSSPPFRAISVLPPCSIRGATISLPGACVSAGVRKLLSSGMLSGILCIYAKIATPSKSVIAKHSAVTDNAR